MDYRDKKYINHVAENVDGYIYEYLILPDETRIYVNPEAFEAYIRTFPADLWAPEFRNAYDTITMYRGPQNDEETEKYLNDALAALRLLAATYCPQIAAELESQQPDSDRPRSFTEVTDQGAECSGAERPALPGGIKDTPGARAAFDCLVAAGYLDSVYKPTASANANVICAYMAISLHKLLGVRRGAWQKCFADFWGVPNLSQSLNQLDWHGKQYVADIDKALTIAAQSCDQLAETQYGKELLSNRK